MVVDYLPIIGRVHCPSRAPGSPRGWCFFSLLVFIFTSFIAFFWLFFPYIEDYPRSQHLVVSLTVCSTHCLCTTNVHLITDIWWLWSPSYARVESGGASRWSYVNPFIWTWCWSLSDRTECIVPIEARRWNHISRFHNCPRLRATCHFIFLSLHWSLWSLSTLLYMSCRLLGSMLKCCLLLQVTYSNLSRIYQ